MNTQQKLLFLPIALMVTVLVVSMFGVEYYLKQTVQKQFEQQLNSLASNALASLTVIEQLDDPIGYQESLFKIVQAYTVNSDFRLTIFRDNGEIIADSHIAVAQIAAIKDNDLPSEVSVALAKRTSAYSAYSDLLSLKFEYNAHYDASLGVIVRAGLPTQAVRYILYDLRRSFFVITVIAVLSLLIFGTFTIKLIRQTEIKADSQLEQKVCQRTKEITLMQTLTTMLNAATTFDDANRLLANLMPKLLPNLSGVIFLKEEQEEQEEAIELVRWGERWQGNVTIIPKKCWQGKHALSDDKVFLQTCIDKHCDSAGESMCIDLVDDKAVFGSIHFVSDHNAISSTLKNVVEQLSVQLSYALANIKIKNKLRNQAIRDPLTNLYNRRFMLEAFEQSLNRADRHNLNLAVLMIDLDHFKQFNDCFGHEAGDLVLTSVAELFHNNLRLEDIACRYGGEEFCIICPDTGLTDAFDLAEKLRKAVGALSLKSEQGELGKLTISLGVALYPNHGRNEQLLLSEADKALYVAKDSGRNVTVVAKSNREVNNPLSS